MVHGDAACEVREVRVIERDDKRGLRGGAFLGGAAADEIARQTFLYVVREPRGEIAEKHSIHDAG